MSILECLLVVFASRFCTAFRRFLHHRYSDGFDHSPRRMYHILVLKIWIRQSSGHYSYKGKKIKTYRNSSGHRQRGPRSAHQCVQT